MKIFHCDHCGQLLFFENVACVRCGRVLAYVVELDELISLDPVAGQPQGGWTSPSAPAGRVFRLCENYTRHNVCNWAYALPASDAGVEGGSSPAVAEGALCDACRLTRTIPNLSREGNARRWYKLEVAKRRLVYTLQRLGLPYASKIQDPEGGLAFEFLEDPEPGTGAARVITGHDGGVITVRTKTRTRMKRARGFVRVRPSPK